MTEHAGSVIRPFTMDRYREVLELWQSCPGVGLSEADEQVPIRSYLARNPGMSFLAEGGGRIVGAILAGHDGRRGYIHHLAVHPDHRRRGLGGRLVDLSLDCLREAGIQKCHLFIYRDNHAGIRFWEASGWSYRTDIAVVSRTLEPGSGGDC